MVKAFYNCLLLECSAHSWFTSQVGSPLSTPNTTETDLFKSGNSRWFGFVSHLVKAWKSALIGHPNPNWFSCLVSMSYSGTLFRVVHKWAGGSYVLFHFLVVQVLPLWTDNYRNEGRGPPSYTIAWALLEQITSWWNGISTNWPSSIVWKKPVNFCFVVCLESPLQSTTCFFSLPFC